MNTLVSNTGIIDACKQFKVKELHVFGSFASGSATTESDVDMIVLFDREGYAGAFDQFMGLKERLETLLGRRVDLLTSKRFRNPLFREEVERTKKLIYAA
jgi:uncharacterized protein